MMIAALSAFAPGSPARALEPAPSMAGAQTPVVEAPEHAVQKQTPTEALAQDASEYARQHDVSLADATRRLHAQEESVPMIDRLQAAYRDRLAGIFIEHEPAYRIVILLTGSEAVADAVIMVGGMNVPIVFRTGAPATRDQILAAIARNQAAIRAALKHPPGMGVDPRSGTLVVMVRVQDADAEGPAALAIRLAVIAGVPVQIRTWADADKDLSIEGGSRVVGVGRSDSQHYVCTTGFVVTDGIRTGVTTAAHCPDPLSYIDRDHSTTPLSMVGAWGARYQDVQIDVGGDLLQPLFYVDTARTVSRPLTSWRNRTSTRAGDFVCHRGERTALRGTCVRGRASRCGWRSRVLPARGVTAADPSLAGQLPLASSKAQATTPTEPAGSIITCPPTTCLPAGRYSTSEGTTDRSDSITMPVVEFETP